MPLAALGVRALGPGLGADPVEKITHVTGDWTLRFLLATLAVTPLRRWLGWARPAPYRRTLGLLAFTYGTLHFATYGLLDLWGAWDTLLEDVLERPYVTAGFTGFVLMLPLAITSTRAWMRRLGKRWVVLHRLVYAAAIAGCLHYLWLVKADLFEPLVYSAILALLLVARLAPARGRHERRE